MPPRTPPFAPYPAWSEAKFFGFLRSALRSASSKWPPKYEVLLAARRPSQSENKRLKWEFQCASCGLWHPQKSVSVDHIIPVGTLRTWDDIAPFCQRLFVGVDGLQVLCSVCHNTKTQEERKKNG
jgi:5-methylcytosine-specific restriction endonuclease McrA